MNLYSLYKVAETWWMEVQFPSYCIAAPLQLKTHNSFHILYIGSSLKSKHDGSWKIVNFK